MPHLKRSPIYRDPTYRGSTVPVLNNVECNEPHTKFLIISEFARQMFFQCVAVSMFTHVENARSLFKKKFIFMSLLAIWDYSLQPSEGTLKSARKAKVGAITTTNHGSQALEIK